MGEADPSLTTAQLAQRTGVPAGTLRMWESRYGFPSPVRLPGGHHRYTDHDVEIVSEVLRLREHGLSISAAIEHARERGSERPASIFAGLRQLRPELAPVQLEKRALLEITWAMEDEYCARAGSGLLIASFQRARFYRRSARRWRELARTSDLACVLADFDSLRLPASAPIEIPIRRAHALAREWTLIIDAPGAHACLAAWEQPTSSALPDSMRSFEVVWSFEPEVVHTATAIACGLIEELEPSLGERLPPADPQVTASRPELRFASGLAQRIVGYLAAEPRVSRGTRRPGS